MVLQFIEAGGSAGVRLIFHIPEFIRTPSHDDGPRRNCPREATLVSVLTENEETPLIKTVFPKLGFDGPAQSWSLPPDALAGTRRPGHQKKGELGGAALYAASSKR